MSSMSSMPLTPISTSTPPPLVQPEEVCVVCLDSGDLKRVDVCCGSRIVHIECMNRYIRDNQTCMLCHADIRDKLIAQPVYDKRSIFNVVVISAFIMHLGTMIGYFVTHVKLGWSKKYFGYEAISLSFGLHLLSWLSILLLGSNTRTSSILLFYYLNMIFVDILVCTQAITLFAYVIWLSIIYGAPVAVSVMAILYWVVIQIVIIAPSAVRLCFNACKRDKFTVRREFISNFY